MPLGWRISSGMGPRYRVEAIIYMPGIPVNSLMCDRCGAWPIYDWCCAQHGQALCRDCLTDHEKERSENTLVERPLDHIHQDGTRHIHMLQYRINTEYDQWKFLQMEQHDHGGGPVIGWISE